MSDFWVQFDNRASGTIQAKDEAEARTEGEKLGKVRQVDVIPYPRSPVLVGDRKTPAFCFGKDECLGRTSCPRSRACDD